MTISNKVKLQIASKYQNDRGRIGAESLTKMFDMSISYKNVTFWNSSYARFEQNAWKLRFYLHCTQKKERRSKIQVMKICMWDSSSSKKGMTL